MKKRVGTIHSCGILEFVWSWEGDDDCLVGTLDLIFIQDIPRRQEFQAIKHLLSFD